MTELLITTAEVQERYFTLMERYGVPREFWFDPKDDPETALPGQWETKNG